MQLVVTKSNTLNAFSWIKQGWRLFTLQPGPFMSMSAILMGLLYLTSLIPPIGIVVAFLMPFLSAGFYAAASRAEQGEKLSAMDIFSLLSQLGKYRIFIRLALLGIIFSMPITHDFHAGGNIT